MAYILDNKHGIEAAISDIKHRGKAIDKDIQAIGIAVLMHVEKHGEVSLCCKLVTDLVEALSKGQRKDSLVTWFVTFGKVSLNRDKASAKARPLVFDKTKVTDIEGATKTPWYAAKKAADPFAVFDVKAEVNRLLSRMAKASKDGRSVQNAALADSIRELMNEQA